MSPAAPALSARPSRLALALVVLVAGIALLFFLSWPTGVIVGLITGPAAVLMIGRRMEAEWALAEPDVLPVALLGEAADPEPARSVLEHHDTLEHQETAGPAVEQPEQPEPARVVIQQHETAGAAPEQSEQVETAGAAEKQSEQIEQAGQPEPPRAATEPSEQPQQPEPSGAGARVADAGPAAEAPAGTSEPVGAPVPPSGPLPELGAVRPELQALKERLGDRDPDFARAAALVITTQYASAARLQRDLHLPYSRARRLLDDLESHHVVGPPTGPSPRRVLLRRDDLADVDLERLLAGA